MFNNHMTVYYTIPSRNRAATGEKGYNKKSGCRREASVQA
jgi:hypothetical protein